MGVGSTMVRSSPPTILVMAGLRPSPVPSEHRFGQLEGLVDPHATVAQSPLVPAEQAPGVRVVEVDRKAVRKHEFDAAERVAVARGLTDVGFAVALDRLVAVVGEVIGIGRKFLASSPSSRWRAARSSRD